MAREMNRFFTCFVGIAFGAMCVVPVGAVTITKAAPVAEQESSAASGASSLVPTVLGLVGGIQQLTAQQKELDAQCVPSNQEITFVNNIMKEWAKAGAMSAEDVKRRLGRSPCTSTSYNTQVMLYASTGQMDICYDTFNDGGMIWDGYPKVGYATYCEDGALQCSNKKTMSDIYEIFNLIDFTDADYNSSELTMAARLMNKIEQCSTARLSAKKRELWGEFLVDTVSSLGQPTNTGTIMEQVSAISGGGALGTIGSFATSLLAN